MAWPWLAQTAKAWGSERRRVPCRQELPRAPVVMVVAVPAGAADPAVAVPAVAVPAVAVEMVVAVETAAAVETAVVVETAAAAVRFRHINN